MHYLREEAVRVAAAARASIHVHFTSSGTSMPTTTTIQCPLCGHAFNVEDVLAHTIEEKYRAQLAVSIEELESRYQEKERTLSVREQEVKRLRSGIEAEVEQRSQAEAAAREKTIQARVEMEFASKLSVLQDERDRVSREIKDLKAAEVENIRLKRELEQKEQQFALEYERKLSDRLKEMTESIQKRETEKILLKLRERDELIATLTRQVDEMQRKAEQGSMQMQGEVQELELEDMLRQEFPYDVVEEVGKGIKGADVIQTVRNRTGADCGRIIFESKRTKAFSPEWISKLKTDAVTARADLCVIVTETLPQGVERIGRLDGVWICSFHHAKGLVLVLRDSLLRIHEAYGSQANKGEKMQMLYDYLTSAEFRMQAEAIVDGFNSLQAGYQKERGAMERIWKEREKQLQKVLLNTNHFLGSVKGIAGGSMDSLRLPGPGDDPLELDPAAEE
jgi:hypothetical protein